MLSTVRNLATAANVAKGLGILFAAVVSVWTAVSAVLADWPTPTIIFITVAVAMAAAILVYFIMGVYIRASHFIRTRSDQTRIMTLLNNLGENVAELDIITAAGIWAGTLELANVERHSYFRGLKNAVNAEEIVPTFMEHEHANKNTRLSLNSLTDYWRRKGVIR